MDASTFSISLVDLLTGLLADHVPKEVAYQEALYEHTKGSKFYGDEMEGDPPIWERTAWDAVVRWLARKSEFFHGMGPADSIDEDPIDTYERLLREYLTEVRGGGPTQSNPVAAELLEFDQQGLVAALCEELGESLPSDLKARLVAHTDIAWQSKLDSVVVQPTEGFVAALLAGRDDQELTPRQLARLEAYLNQPIFFAAIRQAKRSTGESEIWTRYSRLNLIRDFNRQLQPSTGNAAVVAVQGSEVAESKPKRPGRLRADYETQEREAEFAADWEGEPHDSAIPRVEAVS